MDPAPAPGGMPDPPPEPAELDVTGELGRVVGGDAAAVERLLPLVYDELHRLAASRLRQERPDHTLQATALADEVFLRMVDQERASWRDRAHFFAVAAQALRRILVDHARAKGRLKRGGGQERITLDAAPTLADAASPELLDLDEALVRLAHEHPDHERVVELRFFGGLTNAEVAEIVGITERSVERRWQFARAWLFRALADPRATS